MGQAKEKRPWLADDFVALTGRNVSDWFTWQEYFVAASSRAMAGSIAVYDVSGSIQGLRFTSTSSTCAIAVAHLIPQNAASAAPAAGSGTVYVTWTNVTTGTAVAKFTASLIAIPNGSALGDTGASTLGSACISVTGTTASEINTASLFSFNAPVTTNGVWVLRVIVNSSDNDNTSGSDTVVLGYDVRYKADRIGP